MWDVNNEKEKKQGTLGGECVLRKGVCGAERVTGWLVELGRGKKDTTAG